MRELAERACFSLSLTLGKLLRSTRYSATRIARHDAGLQVEKRRTAYAPLLISVGQRLMVVLNTGVRILPQQAWEERERLIWQTLHDRSIRIDADRVLILPVLPGETLASLLENPEVDASVRNRAIELAVTALADFHAMGFTHGDAMAGTVMIDLQAGVAHWFDFETMHDPNRTMTWRRADDVRALLATCLIRSSPAALADVLQRIRDVYADEDVIRLVALNFTSGLHRPLAFHLGQAGLSFRDFRAIGQLLNRPSPG